VEAFVYHSGREREISVYNYFILPILKSFKKFRIILTILMEKIKPAP